MLAQRTTAGVAFDRLTAIKAIDAVELRAANDAPAKVVARAHDATRRSRQRPLEPDFGSGNRIAGMDAKQLRDSARALTRDYDVARTALSLLVQNVVGSGIDVAPAPRKGGGEVDAKLRQQLRDLWWAWWDRPEVTGQHSFGKCQQLMAASWLRDGDVFYQDVMGPVSTLQHGTSVPYSIEMIEADLVPLDFTDASKGILQGVERSEWGRVTAYHVYKYHPGDMDRWQLETKRVPAERMRQVANIDRIHQVRGLSVFAPVMNRFRDVQDYENSERLAHKVAASFCAQIIKGDPGAYGDHDVNKQVGDAVDRAMRSFTMAPGMIADQLLPGEKIEAIDTRRPNANVSIYVNDQLRRAAGGVGVGGSSMTGKYDGSYSAQRQELIEKHGGYIMLSEQFIDRFVRPVWESFVQACWLAGMVRLPAGWTLADLSAATFIRPAMPWIDPLKEVLARELLVDREWLAPQQAILQGGNDPEEVQRLTDDWKREHGAAAPANTQPEASRRERVTALAAAVLSGDS